MYHRLAALIAVTTIATAAHAEDYTLFHPTPDANLRPMSTERPSKTDSIATIDAGHYQVETNLVAYSHNDDCISGNCVESKQWFGGGTTALRIGLTANSEFQIVSDLYRHLEVNDKSADTRTDGSGFGDTVLRYKYNFWGNDGSATGLAGLIYTKLPTNTDHLGTNDIEGGIEFPFVWNFAERWSLGGMTQMNILRDNTLNGSGYYGGYANALVVGKTFDEQWSSYAELYTYRTDINPHWQNTADFGIVYAVNARFRIDTGVNIGISDAADDMQWFTGFAYRF